MIFSWEFSKLLESIIFRNIFIYVLNLIISAKTWRKSLTDEYILRNIGGCYWKRNPSHYFLWGSSHLQKFQEIVADGVTFLLKHRARVHRTLLNAITDVFMRMFWNSYTKTLENIQKNVFSGVPIPDWKFLCKYFSVKESEVLRNAKKRKEILRFRKNSLSKSVSCAFFQEVV